MTGLTNNPIELLVTLGVNKDASKTNINNYITDLKKEIAKLDIEVVIKGDTNFARSLSNQLKGLKDDADKLDETIGGIGKKPKKQPKMLKGFEDELIGTFRHIEQLESYLKSKNYKYKIEMSVDKEGYERVKQVVADVKNKLGEVETIRIKPIVDNRGATTFKQVGSALLNTDTYKLDENIKKAKVQLIEFKQAGKLSANQYKEFEAAITKARTNNELEKTVQLFNQLGKGTAFGDKLKNSIQSTKNGFNELNASLDRFLNKNGRNADMSAITKIREEIAKAQKMPVTNDLQARAVQKEIDTLRSKITTITASASDLKAFNSKVIQVNKEIEKIANTGLLSKNAIATMYKQIAKTPVGDLNQLEARFERIKRITDQLSTKKTILAGIQTTTNNVIALNAQLERSYNLNQRYANQNTYKNLQREIADLAKARITEVHQIEPLLNKYRLLRQEVNAFSAAATQSSRNSMTMLNQLKIAFERFPIWMIASTAFYSAVRTSKAFIDTLIDIDTKLVSIAKVAGSKDIATIFDGAILSAEKFGQSISMVLDAYIEFSRQGYKGLDLENLSSAGLVTANVGEMGTQAASEYLTSALIQWNKESSEAMGIIDSWNEIANNYSTTVEKLAKGHARAGATARSIGLDFHQLNSILGTVTAATKQSGDEVGNFVKNVIPRLVGAPAQDAMQSLGVSLTDSQGNIRDIVQVYTEIANKLQDVSDIQRVTVVEGLAGKFHISRMQALLTDLASADSLYRSMYESSTNSAGSALRENDIYMHSLQARINLVKVEFEKLAVAVGEAFLTDAMIEFMKGATVLLQLITGIVSHVGAFSIAFGSLGFALVLVSKRFRDLSKDIGAHIKQMVLSRNATRTLETATVAAGNAADDGAKKVGRLTKAWKGLLLASGVGLAWFAVGTAIEFFVGKLGNAREKSEELASTNRELLNSYKTSASEIDTLTSRYSALSSEMDNTINPNSDQLQKYYDLQNQIGQLLPTLATGETEYGSKLVGSADALKIKVDLLREQLEIEQEAARIKKLETRNENIDTYKNEIKNARGTVERDYSTFESLNYNPIIAQEYIVSFRDENGNPIYDSPLKLSKLMDDLKPKVDSLTASNPEAALYYQNIISNIENLLSSKKELFNNSDNTILKNTSLLKSEYIPLIEEVIQANNGLDESNKKTATSLSALFINSGNIDNLDQLKNALTSLASHSSSWTVFDKVEEIFEGLNNSTSENFPEMAAKASDSIISLANDLKAMGIHTEDVDTIIAALQSRLGFIRIEQGKYSSAMEVTGKTLAETAPTLREFSDGVEVLDDNMSSLILSFKDYSDEAEKFSRISQKQIDATDSLIIQYQMLTSQLVGYTEQELESLRTKEDLTLSEQTLLATLIKRDDVMNTLSQIYPSLIDAEGQLIESIHDKIAAIEAENEANRVLSEATKLLFDNKLEMEEKSTLATALNTKDRIAYYKSEIAAIGLVLKAVLEMHNQNEDFVTRHAKAQLESQISTYQNEIDKLMPDYESAMSGVKAFVKENEKSSKSTKENIYVTDKYKQALEEINYEIEKQLALQKQFPEHSKEYRESLQKQIVLEKQKLALQQKQSKELASQISSGNIIETGTTSTTTTSKNLSGWSGNITSGYGAKESFRTSPHAGIDIAGKKGTRLDSNVSGKVVAQSHNDISGNYVKIQDSEGYTHFFGHLENAIVKLNDTIVAGQQIGTIGNTGQVVSSTGDGSHLHYEVKNSKGSNVNPSVFVNAAKSNSVYTTNGDSQKAFDELKAKKIDVDLDIIDQEGKIYDLEITKTIDSYIAKFENQKNKLDQLIDNSENRMKKSDETSTSYRSEINNQIKLLQEKKTVNLQEISYLKDLVKNGGLSADTIDDLNNELHELDQANSNIEFAIDDLLIDQLNSALGSYEKLRAVQDETIDSENLRLKEVDTNSKLYGATLEKIIAAMEKKRQVNSQELIDLKNMIDSGKFHGKILEQMTERYKELILEVRNLNLEMQQTDYDIVINIKTQYEEEIDDIQYQIDRLEAIKGSYKEGSADYSNIVKEQVKLQDELTAKYKAEYDALQKAITVRDLSTEKIKEMSEELENLSVAYWNSISASKRMTTELADLEKRQREEIAEKLIDGYKSYLEQRRAAQTRALDAEMNAEEKRHATILKHYEKELDSFRKNIEAKLALLDEEDAKRTYDMDIDELTSERDEVIGKMNLLKNDDSLRAKAERKALQEQLDDIDKQIAEKRYQRDLELRRNELNKKLEEKEEEINNYIEIEDEKYDIFRENLDNQRDYWDAHYDNLINDERKFAEIRQEIMSGNFEDIKNEFGDYIQEMSDMMPTFAGSMAGAMESVGNSIRLNVIDALNDAIKLMNKFNSSQTGTNQLPDGSGDIIGGGTGSSSGGSGSSSGSGDKPINGGDMKVLLAKYMAEELVAKETNESIKSSIRSKANTLAAEGRSEGSVYKSSETLDSILSKLTKSDKVALGNYVNSAASKVVNTDYLQEYIKSFAARLLSSGASLSIGGMIPSTFGGGIDGKGGRSVVVHPEEIINNPLDSKRLLGMANVLERAASFISPLISKIPLITKEFGTGGDQFVVNFGNVYDSNTQQAENFAKEFINNIRVKKGGK